MEERWAKISKKDRPNVNLLLHIIEIQLDVTHEQMIEDSRIKEITDARAIAYTILREEERIPSSAIAKLFNTAHSTVHAIAEGVLDLKRSKDAERFDKYFYIKDLYNDMKIKYSTNLTN